MGEIKSAWELALERTRDIESDPEGLRRHEAETDGKRLYARLRNGEDVDVQKAIKEQPKDRRKAMRRGLFNVALENLTLPRNEGEMENVDVAERVLGELVRDRGALKSLLSQVRQFFSQYLDDRRQLTEQLRKQYEPRMKQMEQQYQQQYGRSVRLDPSSDPEFSKALNDNLGRLDQQYRSALEEVYTHLRSMFTP
jgi:hypothetical protein